MVDFSKVIENDIELSIYKEKEQEIKNYLTTFGDTSFWEIISKVGGSERRMLRLLNEMEQNGEISFNKKNNKFYIQGENRKHDNYICENCNATTMDLKGLRKLKTKLKKIWDNKPKPTLLFDQRPVTMETSIRRVAYLLSKNDIYKKNVVFLGDDDLTSVCLAFANDECDITVFDADERLINYINDVASTYKLKIVAKVLNVMDKVPKEYIGKFDVLMTDPTPERIPFTVFTNVAIDLVKPLGVIYTSIYSTAMSKSMDLQRVITEMNLYITEMIPNFTHYQAIYKLYRETDIEMFEKYNVPFDDNSICFTETLFRMLKTKETRKIPINFTLKDMMGKATKRVMKDSSNEVADIDGFLKATMVKMQSEENKIIEG